MTTGTVDHRVVDDVAVITINQPGRLNAWTRAMRHELLTHIERVSLEPDALGEAIVITGAGNAFCSGQDLTEAKDWNAAFASTWVPEFKKLYDAVRTCPKPSSSREPQVPHGRTLGWGQTYWTRSTPGTAVPRSDTPLVSRANRSATSPTMHAAIR